MKSVKFTAETINNIVATIKNTKKSFQNGIMDICYTDDNVGWVLFEQDGVDYVMDIVFWDTVVPETEEVGTEFYIQEDADGHHIFINNPFLPQVDVENIEELQAALPVIEGCFEDIYKEVYSKK